MSPEDIKTLIELEVKQAVDPVHEKLDEIKLMLAKYEGAGVITRFIFAGFLPAAAALVTIWFLFKDHLK